MLAENIPAALASTWRPDAPVFLTAKGQVILQAAPSKSTDQHTLGVIGQSAYPGDYTLTHLTSDTPLSAVSFRVDMSDLPGRLSLSGFAGARIVLLRATSER